MADTMQAVVVRAPMEFEVEAVPVPEVPVGGLLLSVNSCGLCGSDLRTLRSGHRKVTFPWTIGHEVSGTIVEVGPGYQGVPVGEVAVGRPDFLAVHDKAIILFSVEHLNRCQIGAVSRFAECLAPNHLPGGDARQEPFLLFIGTFKKNSRSDDTGPD